MNSAASSSSVDCSSTRLDNDDPEELTETGVSESVKENLKSNKPHVYVPPRLDPEYYQGQVPSFASSIGRAIIDKATVGGTDIAMNFK